MTTGGKIATGFVLGTVLGSALGLLFAPKKGSKTRALISEKAKEMSGAVGKKYEKAKAMVGMGNRQHETVVE